IRDADGHPLPGAEYHVQWQHEGRDEMEGGSVGNADASVDRWDKPGVRYQVSAQVGDYPPAEAVAVLDERNETEVTLTPRAESGPRGTIRISVADPMGSSIPQYEVELTTELAGALVEYTREPLESGLLPPLPPGRYRLEVK